MLLMPLMFLYNRKHESRSAMRRYRNIVRLAVAVFTVVAAIVLISSQTRYYRAVKDAQYIYPGIRICGVDVGSLTVEQAVQKVDSQAGDIVIMPVVISWQQHEYELSRQKLRSLAIREMAERAYTYGRMGGNFERWLSIVLMPAAKHDITPDMSGDWPGLADYLLEAAGEFEAAPQNAGITSISLTAPSGGRIQIRPDSPGHELDIKKTARNVASAVCAGLGNADAVMYDRAADITYDAIKELDGEPVSASFAFEGQETAAFANNMLSGGRFLLMHPGQTLSVRDLIEYNANFAYDVNYNLAALHIASTAFNCAVQAGLAIPEHSGTDTMPRMLYAPGTEAVVNADKDLVIENMLNTPVVLGISGGWQDNLYKVTCSIFRSPMHYSALLKSFCDTAGEGAYAQVFRVWVNPDGTEAGRELIDEIRYR